MKPRILQLVDSFDEGGSERQAVQLARLLVESERYDVRIASLKAEGVLRADVDRLALGEIETYPLTSFYDRNAMVQLSRFVKYLRRSHIDVLQTHDFYTNIFGMTAGFLAGTKVRIASRRETTGMRSKLQQRTQQTAFKLAHAIVANSQAVRLKLIEEGVNQEKIRVIYNGLDLSRVSPDPELSREAILKSLGIDASETKQFVTIIANMRHEVKDYPMFLRSAQRVMSEFPAVGFLLAGEGPLTGSLQNLASELGIEGATVFLGRAENIAELLQVSDVCVLSSKAEGFSNSILEYMAAVRPVVATKVGGAAEAIVEGETGYLVASGDDCLMAERVISLLQQPTKARLMGHKGRLIVEKKFSPSAQLEETEALYQRLLHEKSSVVPVDEPKAKRKVVPTES